MFLMTVSVVTLSVFFLVFTRSLVDKSQVAELKNAENTVFLAMENAFEDEDFLKNSGGNLGSISALPYYVTYIVYDSEKSTLIATNDPFLPFLPNSKGKVKHFFEKNYFFDGDLNIVYYAQEHFWENESLIVAVALNMDNNSTAAIFASLPTALLLMALPILLLSFFLSLFITKKTIEPVKKITKAAQSLTVENLSDLLPLSGHDDEIDELSKTFNALFLRLKRDFDRERQFSSDVSHELNTPLTVISGQAGLLLRWGKDNSEQLEKSLNAIKNEAKTMHAIIENLLQISRIESGRIKPQISEVVLNELFSWLVEEFSAVAPDMRIVFEPSDLSLQTDSEMLHQILTVLISNSLKYAGQFCTVELKAQKTGEKIIIEQCDDGNGFSENALPHIFERFYRADEAHSRKISGSGLGLAIAQTLCTALGAKISASNRNPHGAQFKIEF